MEPTASTPSTTDLINSLFARLRERVAPHTLSTSFLPGSSVWYYSLENYGSFYAKLVVVGDKTYLSLYNFDFTSSFYDEDYGFYQHHQIVDNYESPGKRRKLLTQKNLGRIVNELHNIFRDHIQIKKKCERVTQKKLREYKYATTVRDLSLKNMNPSKYKVMDDGSAILSHIVSPIKLGSLVEHLAGL